MSAGFLPPLPPANLADQPSSEQPTSAFDEAAPTLAPSSAEPRLAMSRSNSSASIQSGNLPVPRSRASSLLRAAPLFPSGANGQLAPPVAQKPSPPKMVLEFADGTAYEGISFGAPGKSISGECVFQTGMSPDHRKKIF